MGIEFVTGVVEESTKTVVNAQWDTSLWGEDSQQVWGELREQGAVLRCGSDLAVLTSPEAIRVALRNPTTFSSNPRADYFGSETGAIPLQIDPPEHKRYRTLLDPLFSPRRMAPKEDAITEVANRMIDGFIERGSVDFSTEFAVPFPTEVFLHLMGLPLDRRDEFLRVKDQLIRASGDTEEERAACRAEAGAWIFRYINQTLDERKDSPSDDLLTYLSNLEDDARLTRNDVLNICLLFIPAGLDTVTCALECSIAYLAQHPERRQEILDSPGLVPAAVEELLRYESPVPQVMRVTMTDTEVSGCPIEENVRVRVMLGVANHDPETFASPDVVDFHRPSNQHLAFGGGIHRCVGSHLARLELRIALREIHRRLPDYRLPEGTALKFRFGLRDISHLPLEFTPTQLQGERAPSACFT